MQTFQSNPTWVKLEDGASIAKNVEAFGAVLVRDVKTAPVDKMRRGMRSIEQGKGRMVVQKGSRWGGVVPHASCVYFLVLTCGLHGLTLTRSIHVCSTFVRCLFHLVVSTSELESLALMPLCRSYC